MHSEPATKGDIEQLRVELRAELASKADLEQLRVELRAELASKADLEQLRVELRSATKADLAALEEGLSGGLARHTQAILEEMRRWVAVLDDKFSAQSDAHRAKNDTLRAEFEAHCRDDNAHRPARRRRTR